MKVFRPGWLACTFLGLSLLTACAGPSSEGTFQSIRIEKGASIQAIARQLNKAGVISHPIVLRGWAFVSPGRGPRPGLYAMSSSWSARKVWRQLLQGPAPVRVTFPEGWTSRQMARRLAEKNITPASDFMARVEEAGAEGYLFPDTYEFEQESPAAHVVERMTRRFHEQVPPDFEESAKRLGLTPRELMILSSMVEREARVAEERPLVAGIFLNRLKKRWLLESCATVQYALAEAAVSRSRKDRPGELPEVVEWKARLTYKDLAVSSPYNTYRHRGLPPGPIGNPGRAALDAAAHPVITDMMFFVAEGDGTHRFSRYYKDHLKAKKKQ